MLTVLRPAKPEESAQLAKLHAMATDGVAEYVWRKAASGGETIEQVGASRFRSEAGLLSYRNSLVLIGNRSVAAMMVTAPADPSPSLPADPVLRPYAELKAPGTLYVASLSVAPELRGSGLGGRLLDIAFEKAAGFGLPGLSLLCAEENHDAVRFYNRRGFKETDRRKILPAPGIRRSGFILLMQTQSS